MGVLKNVIVFALGASRYAVELRWVEEVFTLGYVTPVPGAPEAIVGVVNRRGSITPVLNLIPMLVDGTAGEDFPSSPIRQGHGAILIQVEEIVAAIPISNVVEVATLRPRDDGGLRDSSGTSVTLIDPPAIFHKALEDAGTVPVLPQEEAADG
jgi:chemotaxis signal transduction protein